MKLKTTCKSGLMYYNTPVKTDVEIIWFLEFSTSIEMKKEELINIQKIK